MNRIHAIFGTSESCIATHPSDMAVAMIALNAQVHTQQPDGNTRQIALRDFYREPGDTPHIETQLDEDELITHVSIKKKQTVLSTTQSTRPFFLCVCTRFCCGWFEN